MPLNKTPNLNLNIWPEEYSIREELNSNFSKIDVKSKDFSDKIEVLSKRLEGSVSVKEFGAMGNGKTDDTQAFKDTIEYARNAIITSQFKTSMQVIIPGGIYKITSKITISPYVHLKVDGLVIIDSYVVNQPTIHFTPQSSDPDFLNILSRQQYCCSPLINGANGGMAIRSRLERTTNKTIGLELGSQTNLGEKLPLARYSLCDIAITGFDIAMQMNIYNNYIGTFNNLHLELNNTLMRFGTTTGDVVNSGENFNFHGGVFAGAKVGFEWLVDGMDCNFYGCSFDFMDIVFHLQRGWKRVGVWGGHIEGIKGGNEQGIVVANELGTVGVEPQVFLSSPIIYCNSSKLFKGNFALTCDNVRWERGIIDRSNLYICDSSVKVVEKQHLVQGYELAVSSKLNNINNSTFKMSDLSLGDAKGPFMEYTITSEGFSEPVVTTTIPSSSDYTRALTATSTVSSGSWMEILTHAYKAKAGDRIQGGTNIYMNATTFRNIEFKFDFYDRLGNLISSTANYANQSGILQGKWNSIFGYTSVAPPGTDSVRMCCTVSKLINKESFFIGELFLGIS